MRKSLESRVDTLEVKASDNRLTIVVVMDGETQADALARAGCSSEEQVLFCSELDAML